MFNPGLIFAIGLALIHAFAAKLPIFAIVPRFRWTSFAGGVSLSYVFLEILPELGHTQAELQHAELPLVQYLENHVYILALLGLLAFYGLDSLALQSRSSQSTSEKPAQGNAVFWIHMTGFALLNVILGYLLQEVSHSSLIGCVLFFVAIALHFFIIDETLREHHQALYDRQGRWVLVGAIVVGAIAGQLLHLNEAAIAIVWSFLAGSIILNVLKRELPDEKESCFGSFISGTALFAALVLLM